jgi:hypothetical protein
MRLASLGLSLSLAACQGDDAYLGSERTPYVCGSRCKFEQGVSEDAGDWFSNPATDLGDAPEIVYPLDGAVHPKDLRELTVQFQHGRSDLELYRVRIAAPDSGLAFDFFTPCLAIVEGGCRYLLKGSVWDNARDELIDKPVVLSVTGATGSHGFTKASKPVTMNVSPSKLQNKGFYYWTTERLYSGDVESQTGIYRLPFGADRAEPFIMPNTATNERSCGACHSVSRDGSTIAFTAVDGSPDQRAGVLVTTNAARPATSIVSPAADATYDSSMMTLSSDGKRVLVAYDDRLVLRNSGADPKYATGEVIATLMKQNLLGKSPYFPEFSFDNSAVVLTLSDEPDSAIAVQSGDIAVMEVDLATSSFAEPKIVVQGSDSEFHFYPTWSPGGNYIAFASAPRELAEDGFPRKSYDQKRARLRLVHKQGGDVYELTRATQSADSWSTFPKFAPFQDGDLMYLTFNSKIDYGLLVRNAAKADKDKLAQLWMSAIDLGNLPNDPSTAPIWLPFQDATQSSHLGIWTSEVKCRSDLGGASCDLGQRCEPKTNTCVVDPK